MMARRSETAAPGFTMIELVMVILILGILSITLLPRFVSPSAFSERVYFDDLRQSLMYARDIALARGCRVQAVLYTADFYFMQDVDCDSATYQRSDYTQSLMRPDQTERLEFNAFDGEGHQALELASHILVFDPSGIIRQDDAGVLEDFDTVTLTVGARTLTLHGDSAYVE